MQRLWLFIIFGTSVFQLLGQPPQKVVRITRASYPVSWYQTQSRLWQQALKTHPENASGWQSYYEANRALRNLQESHVPLDEIMQQMKTAVPNSFEYHYLSYRNGEFNQAQQAGRFASLEKAHQIAPDRTEVWEEYVTHYELMGQLQQRKEANQKRYRCNDIPSDLLAYNYNVLMSLEPNAILFTNGDNDTYPLWLLQDALGIRSDVIVLNRSLSYEQTYLNQLLRHYQISAFEREIRTQADLDDYHPALRQHLLLFSKRPLYYAATVSPAAYADIKDRLYLVGLAFVYSGGRLDNEKQLAYNVENKFLLDYLKVDLAYQDPHSPVRQLEQAYLTPMLTLHRYYRKQGETGKAEATKALILKIARRAGREAEVAQAFE